MKIKQKIQVCRASGMPVKLENLEKFQEEYRILYDKVLKRFDLDPESPKTIDEDTAKRVSWLLDRCEKRLFKKYPNTETWDIVTSKKAWLKLVEKHGPIMLAKSETGDLAYVIYDREF